MEFIDKLNGLADKIEQISGTIQTEEATKNALIMPFIQNILGYDVFNPLEVVPEYVCDVGTKKGEKVDYAIIKDGQVQILIECKKIGEPLNVNHASQLFRYFHATSAKISILTNGRFYKFFTDLDALNKMDEKPFLELDLLDIDNHVAPELEKLTKSAFDLDSIILAAGDMKYVSQIKREILKQFKDPDDDFARLFVNRAYDGRVVPKIMEQFNPLIRKALTQFLTDQVNERLKSALTGSSIKRDDSSSENSITDTGEHEESLIVTTQEELEGFFIVKSIIRKSIDANRVGYRDTQSYFGILIDDNNRKPICRLHFNRTQKYIGIFDSERKEIRHPIAGLDDIYQFSDALEATAKQY